MLLEHKAEFDFGPHDPVFANRNGQRNAVDNVRRTIVKTAVERADELLAARSDVAAIVLLAKRLVCEWQHFGQAADLEDGLDLRRPLDDRQAPPVTPGVAVGCDQRRDAG
jgi:hypothetical protein